VGFRHNNVSLGLDQRHRLGAEGELGIWLALSNAGFVWGMHCCVVGGQAAAMVEGSCVVEAQ
jgi:hypothetical protein